MAFVLRPPQNENERLAKVNLGLELEVAQLNKAIKGLKSDVAREHQLVRLVEDTLPANSDRVRQ
eukprot:scaffold651410_cov46-Prasinocladus_malaysianus.AAC.1